MRESRKLENQFLYAIDDRRCFVFFSSWTACQCVSLACHTSIIKGSFAIIKGSLTIIKGSFRLSKGHLPIIKALHYQCHPVSFACHKGSKSSDFPTSVEQVC